MSRCILKPREELEAKVSELVVGYDRPFAIWFFQVFGGQDKDGDYTVLIDEWGSPEDIALKMVQYMDTENDFNQLIYSSVCDSECPQTRYKTGQVLDYRTTKLTKEGIGMFQKLTEDDTRDLAIWLTDLLVELGYVKDCTDTNDEEELEVQDMIVEAIEDCGVRGGSELVVASIADSMMMMGLQTYAWDLDQEARTDVENHLSEKIKQFGEERCLS